MGELARGRHADHDTGASGITTDMERAIDETNRVPCRFPGCSEVRPAWVPLGVTTMFDSNADVGVACRSPGTNEESPVFRADGAFLYLIVDRRHGSTLFMGRVADPRS